MADLEVAREGAVLRLTLNRPESLNAATGEMIEALASSLEAAVADDSVRAVLVTGAGRAFCSGADLSGLDPTTVADGSAMILANRAIRAITSLDKPVLAAINGPAAGFGCALALACDLAVIHPSATLGLTFTRIGLMPDGGTTATVAASIGRARAMRMALLAEPLSAQEAHDAGLVSHIATEQTYDEVVADLLDRLVGGAPLALAATKKAINTATLPGLEEALQTELRGQRLLATTSDVVEGVTAFLQRRRAGFTGD